VAEKPPMQQGCMSEQQHGCDQLRWRDGTGESCMGKRVWRWGEGFPLLDPASLPLKISFFRM